MLHAATIGGIRGFSDIHTRRISPLARAWRGAFIFRPEDEQAIEAFADEHQQVWYEAIFEGVRKRMAVKITGLTHNHLAFFEGMGEPQEVGSLASVR